MRRLIPLIALATLGLAACEPKAEAPAAPARTAAAPATDAAPGHVRREAQAQSAKQQIEAQMAAQMQADAASQKPAH